MTIASQKRKAVEALVFEDLGTALTENIASEKPTARPSKSPKLHVENLVTIKTSLRKEILSDLNKILAENQKELDNSNSQKGI